MAPRGGDALRGAASETSIAVVTRRIRFALGDRERVLLLDLGDDGDELEGGLRGRRVDTAALRAVVGVSVFTLDAAVVVVGGTLDFGGIV